MASRKAILWILVAGVLVVATVAAVFVTLTPPPTTVEVPRYADTYISSTSPTQVHGLEPLLWLSRMSSGQENWTLITFDTMGRWESGDRILSATVHVRVAVPGAGTWPAVVRGARITSAWTEGNATWAKSPLMTFEDNSTTPLSRAPRVADDVALDVTAEFAHWLKDGGVPNFSTGLAFSAAVGQASVAFASQENGTLPGPVLTVTFQTAPPGTYVYGVGGLAILAAWRPD